MILYHSLTPSLTIELSEDGKWTVNDPKETFIINANPNEYSYGLILRDPALKQQPKEISQIPATPTFIKDENVCQEGFGARFTF